MDINEIREKLLKANALIDERCETRTLRKELQPLLPGNYTTTAFRSDHDTLLRSVSTVYPAGALVEVSQVFNGQRWVYASPDIQIQLQDPTTLNPPSLADLNEFVEARLDITVMVRRVDSATTPELLRAFPVTAAVEIVVQDVDDVRIRKVWRAVQILKQMAALKMELDALEPEIHVLLDVLQEAGITPDPVTQEVDNAAPDEHGTMLGISADDHANEYD